MKGVVLWTGGKDSAMALYRAEKAGYEILGLATFVPKGADFLAHPLPLMAAQAQAMGLKHRLFPVEEPYEKSYEGALERIRKFFGNDTVITGDIAPVNGYPNWIRERSRPLEMEVFTPLWEEDREDLWKGLWGAGICAVFSGVRRPFLDETWLGKPLDASALKALKTVAEETDLDICGEQGEYHTLVLDGPFFRKRLVLNSVSKEWKGPLAYLRIDAWTWVGK